MILDIIIGLGSKFGNLFVFAFILSRLKSVRHLLAKKPVRLKDKLILSLVFGGFGIVGTYFSIEFNGALVNTRIIGVATGGLLGGPLVGLLAGVVAGIHRFTIDSGSFTTIACSISTVFEGLMAGYMGKFISDKRQKWVYAMLTGAIAESMRKISVLIFSRPFADALDLVKAIWIPMVVINSIGLALLFMIIESMFKEHEKQKAYQASLVFDIVDRALPFFKQGIHSDSIKRVVSIIYEMTEFDGVSITDNERVIAYVGPSKGIYEIGDNIGKDNIRDMFKDKDSIIINNASTRSYNKPKNKNIPFIMIPLKEKNEIIGTLRLYKNTMESITAIDIELAHGLGRLFSTQFTLNKLEKNSNLLAIAELKTLQAQINPHFLFNSLTVIASLCRIDVEKARNLIIHLSNFFRKNLNINKELIDLDTEINHVKSYVEIEKARFEDKLQIIYDIEPNTDCLIPPLTLQPLVENSIKHGILSKKTGGVVKIKAWNEGYLVNISVIDNGVGMENERIEEVLNRDNMDSDSVGINNVNQRLKGIFGEDYGLSIKSDISKGTEVYLRIPQIKEGLKGDKIA